MISKPTINLDYKFFIKLLNTEDIFYFSSCRTWNHIMFQIIAASYNNTYSFTFFQLEFFSHFFIF